MSNPYNRICPGCDVRYTKDGSSMEEIEIAHCPKCHKHVSTIVANGATRKAKDQYRGKPHGKTF